MTSLFGDFRSDLAQGMRHLIRNPGTSAVAILALALGIGLTTTMFSIVYGVMFRGLPYPGSDRLVAVIHTNPAHGMDFVRLSVHDYYEYRARQQSIETLAAYSPSNVALSGEQHADRVEAVQITANAFQVLDATPLLGRVFIDAEDRRAIDRVVVLGHTMWRDRYGSDSAVVGRAIRINGVATTVVGVMREGFQFPGEQQLWLPLDLDRQSIVRGQSPMLQVFGKTKPGVSRDQALAEFTALAAGIEQNNPTTNEGVRPLLRPLLDAFVGEQARGLLLTMLGAVLFVLLIACTNVASLSLARAVQRSGEVALRAALGASRGRIARQFFTEALVLSVVGAVLGAVIAYAGVRMFNAVLPPSRTPFFIDIRIDAIALAAVLALTVMAALIAGAIPARQASRADVMGVLKEGAGNSAFRLGRASRALVAFEIALSCGLLVAAGLTIRSVAKLRDVDLGFDHRNIFTGYVTFPEQMYPDSVLPGFYERLSERIGANPGFTNSTLASALPGLGGAAQRLEVDGRTSEREHDRPFVLTVAVAPSYLSTLGIAVVEGRGVEASDRVGSERIAVVNRAFVARHLAGESAVGRRVRLRSFDAPAGTQPEWLTIVGVVADARLGELAGDNERDAILIPLAQNPVRFVSVIARAQGAPLSTAPAVRGAIAELDADLPLFLIDTLEGRIAEDTWFFGVFGGLFVVFGGAALVLAAIGLYGVMAFSVKQRSRELAIRMAVGADQGRVMRMVLRQGLRQIVGGMLVGLVLAAGLSQLLAVILFDVNARDPVVFGGVALLLVGTSIAACIIPALRATAADPLGALRRT